MVRQVMSSSIKLSTVKSYEQIKYLLIFKISLWHVLTTDHEVHGSRRHDGVQAGDGGQLIIAYLWVGLKK